MNKENRIKFKDKNKIPTGTLKRYESYKLNQDGTRDIPLKDIITIDFIRRHY